MNVVYNYILEFIDFFFPNDLDISLLKMNELLAYILTTVLIFGLIRGLLKIIKVIK